jgi:hypothetical protein
MKKGVQEVEEDRIYQIQPWGARRRGGMEGGDGQRGHRGRDGRTVQATPRVEKGRGRVAKGKESNQFVGRSV